MNITNKYNLPEAMVKALTSDYEYKDKRYSVTSLLSPLRETLLKRRYHDQIETDAVDMIWALWGTGIHKILEQETGLGQFSEVQLEHKFDNNYTLSGYADFIDLNKRVVIDYKSTSVYQYGNSDSHDKWKKQLQMYAYLYYKMHREWIDKGQIWLFMRDWSKSKYTSQYNYPSHPIASIEFELGTPEEVENFILKNLNKLIAYEHEPDFALPLCTPEERWNSGDTWAVVEKGKKRALKVFDKQIDANYMATRLTAEGSNVTIEERKGIDRKCLDYCSVNIFCDYYNKTYSNFKGEK
jgi:hypothetical protein